MTFSVASRMMLVNINIQVWEGRKLDKKITQKTIEDNSVKRDDGLRVNKLLVRKDSMKVFLQPTGELRQFVRDHTVPWKETTGERGLLRQMYPTFIQGFHELEKKWADGVDDFVDNIFLGEKARASFDMGDAYNADDYPTIEDLRSRFKVTLDMDAVAESTDFRVQLDDDTVAEIQDKIKTVTEERVNAVMKDVWERVSGLVEHYVKRTAPDIQRFHDATVTNLQELVDLLPGLNLIGDPNLKAISKRLKTDLLGIEPKDLKEDLDVRAAARQQAADILEDMKGFMGAFGV